MSSLANRHVRFGWWTLLVFILLGIALEAMHALKVSWYLGTDNATRRLMFTLAHAHGDLLALVNLAFAFTLRLWGEEAFARRRLISALLIGATILLPGGFLIGGIVIYDGDPGDGILLVPAGALLLVGAITLTARQAGRRDER